MTASKTEVAPCPGCGGAGIVRAMTYGHGPDDYEYDADCPACGGTGSADLAGAINALPYQQHTVKPHTAMVSKTAVLEIIKARAAIAAPPGWQPIETAPKDGSLFLCWVSARRWSSPDGNDSSHEHDVSQVDFCSWRDGPSDLPGHGYFDPCCGQIGDSQDVTHWMPLPAPPYV